MNILAGIVVFLLIWWTALFAVLPFGHEREADGKPVEANIKKKLIWTTIVSIVLWGMVFALIESELISFREMANAMIEEDALR